MAKCSGPYAIETETSLMSDTEVFRYNLGHLHRLVSDGDSNGVRQVDHCPKIVVIVKVYHNKVYLTFLPFAYAEIFL